MPLWSSNATSIPQDLSVARQQARERAAVPLIRPQHACVSGTPWPCTAPLRRHRIQLAHAAAKSEAAERPQPCRFLGELSSLTARPSAPCLTYIQVSDKTVVAVYPGPDEENRVLTL